MKKQKKVKQNLVEKMDKILASRHVKPRLTELTHQMHTVGLGTKMLEDGKNGSVFAVERIPSQYLCRDGELCDIDNSFWCKDAMASGGNEAADAESGDEESIYYCNRANDFSFQISERLKKHLFSVAYRNYSFSWMLLDAYNETASSLKKGLRACYKNHQTREAQVAENNPTVLRYPFFQRNSDLAYQMKPAGFWQKIVLHKKRAKYEFAFMLQTYDLVMREEENGDFVLVPRDVYQPSKADGVFRLSRPWIQDVSGKLNGNVSVDVRQITDLPNRYLIKVKLDAAWLNDAERDYPVTFVLPFEKEPGGIDSLPFFASQMGDCAERGGNSYVIGRDNAGEHAVCMRVYNPTTHAAFSKKVSNLSRAAIVWDIQKSTLSAEYLMKIGNCVRKRFFVDASKKALVLDISAAMLEMITCGKPYFELMLEAASARQEGGLCLSKEADACYLILGCDAPKTKKHFLLGLGKLRR